MSSNAAGVSRSPLQSQTGPRPTKRGRSRKQGETAAFSLLIGPPFVVLFLITAVPLAISLYTSLLDWNRADPNGATFVGLANFQELLTDGAFWKSVGLTGYQVVGTVTLQLMVGIPLALLLSREFRGAKVIRSLYLLPMMSTPVVVGLMWKMLLSTDSGVVNYLLGRIGLGPFDFLGSSALAMPSIIGTDVWLSTPFVVIILIAGLQSLSQEVLEASRVDGAGPWQQFRLIILPMIRPMIMLAVLFRTMDAIKRFDTIYVMTGGGPGNATETLDLHAYFYAFTYLEVGKGAAVATIMLGIIVGVSSLLLRFVRPSD